MKKKLLTLSTIGFSLFFLIFVFDLTKDISQLKRNLLKSPNIFDATDLIYSKLYISSNDLPLNGDWSQLSYKAEKWKSIKIPTHQILKEPGYKEGHFVYYRIVVPKEAFKNLNHLKNETSLALYYILLSKVDVVINGKHLITNKPKSVVESLIMVPVEEGKDNIIAIKGFIEKGNSGIDHREPILLGRTAELNELYRASYKRMTIFPLIFLLSKGGILFIFSLIYILLNVERSFENFLIFGLCTVVEELLAGDYLHGPLNYYQMVYLYNTVNIGAVASVLLFFSDILGVKISSFKIRTFLIILTLVSFGLAVDSLYWNQVVTITNFMKFWNLMMVAVMISFIANMYKQDKVLFSVICISISLYVWSALFSNNVGLNMKAYGNLLLYFMVAYQTIAMFRKEQIRLIIQERKLREQEKDVAIAKTAKLLAHDVRKPLELMQILLSKISSGEGNTEFIETAKRDIDFSIANVSYQVSDIINFSKVSKVELSETSFYKVLAASIRQVMAIHPELQIDLRYDFKSKNKILADESRLAGALVNLLANAVEAIKEIGGKQSGVIRFSTTSIGNEFVFKIFNDGPSIPEDSINHIFEPLFSRGKSRGTGLGLSSVMKSISDHQGSISVKNCLEGGVEFSASLKLSNSLDEFIPDDFRESSRAYNYSVKDEISKEEKRKFRMFLLDDDAQTIQYFQFLITKLPFDVSLSFAGDFDEGVELINKQRYDLYVLDYDLGGDKSGLEFYKEHLNFLKDEVIFHASRDLYDPRDLPCKYFNKPISLYDLSEVCEQVYENRLRILFVDDTRLFQIAWSSYHGSHNLYAASSPEEALEIFKTKASEFDLCVLDYNYEDSNLNGEQLARKFSEIRNDVKIVIASSLDQQSVDFKSISKRDYEVRKL